MRVVLLDLIGDIEDVRKEFYISGGNGMPRYNKIKDKEKFLRWKQELLFELQEIFDRSNDQFIWSVLVLLRQKFNGRSDESSFSELVGSLKVIEKNIDKYYPQTFLEPTQKDYLTEINKVIGGEQSMIKQPKIFISHSSSDINIVSLFVELLEGIGLGSDQLFCSSVVGYGIPIDEDIYDYLKKQFDEFELHVIFLLSDNYYNSPACMNEMGAAWVLKNRNTMILAPGFEFHSIKGAVNPRQIGLKLDSSVEEVKEKLGGMRNLLVTEFGLSKIPDIRWETKRDNFIEKISSLFVTTNKVNDKEDYLLISDFGIKILKNMGFDASGTLIKIKTLNGTSLQANGRNMIETDERREIAKWEAAIVELLQLEFIVPRGHKGEIFELTVKGYDYVDSIKESEI